MLKIGILGAGYMGGVHGACYARNPHCRLEYIFDRDIARAEAAAGRWGCKAASDIGRVLDGGMDVIDVCLPTDLHHEHVRMAAGAARAILCEKPMAMSLAQADGMIAAAQRRGSRFMVAHVLRFWPAYARAKEIVDRHELGDPLCAAAARMQSLPAWSHGNWIADPARSLGGVVDLQIHDIDFLSWAFGPVETLRSMGTKTARGAWDQVFTVMEHASGVKCSLEANNMMPGAYPFTQTLRMVFSGGSVEYDSRQGERLVVYENGLPARWEDFAGRDAYQCQIDHFVDCVRRDREFSVITPRQARQSLFLSLRSGESLDGGRECRMNHSKETRI